MLNDQTGPAGTRDPQPYDLVRLTPGNRLGIAEDVVLVIADTVDHAPGVLEAHHQMDHPHYMDWAAALTVDDIDTVIRVTGDTVHSWTPRP